ncbi:FHA domain-containing protein, partial [Mesorhizobium sp. BR1-1-16]|nr:FHA domain-containing protein [Mesorhizobium sp. BR1-1-16]
MPNAGPLSFRSDGRSFEIGREGGDWILPDPDLFISGRHCEVRFEQGDFWLFDHSRNGTFVNGTSQRIASPYRLANGDRLRIGRYELQVEIDGRRGGVADIRAGPATMARSAGKIYPPAVGPRADGFFTDRENEALRREREGIAVRPLPREGVAFSSEPFMPAASSPGMSSTGRSADKQVPGEEPSGTSILRAIALGAGVSPEVFEQRDPHEVATEIGAVLRIAVDELAQLLKARAAAKALVKSHDRTMIGPADNNPIKFVPGSEDVLDIMFARR